MVKAKDELSSEELRVRFVTLVSDMEAALLTEDKPEPETMQDIPELFTGMKQEGFKSTYKDPDSSPRKYKMDTTKVVKAALWIAKKYNLVPRDTPLRQVWYAFIKLAIEKSGNKIGNPDQTMSKAFSDIIKDTNYYYSDFGVKNEPANFWTPVIDSAWEWENQAALFPNTLVSMEKRSYYAYLKNLADLLGISIYSTGGQSALSMAETISKEILRKFGDRTLHIFSVSDYDPSGLLIEKGIQDHINLFFDRKGVLHEFIGRAPLPDHFEPDELDRAKYTVKKSDLDIWQTAEMNEERGKAGMSDTEGMEVEGLPAQPLPSQIPAGMSINDAIGQARMRIIIYDALLKRFGLDQPYRAFLDRYFYRNIDETAVNIINKNSGIDDLEIIKSKINNRLEEIIENNQDDLSSEIYRLEEALKEWRSDTRQDLYDDNNTKNNFQEELRKAIIINEKQAHLSYVMRQYYPEIPQHYKDWVISNTQKKKIEKNKEYFEGLLEELDNLKKETMEDIFPEEDE